jgi:HK97 gp10 family phage protein
MSKTRQAVRSGFYGDIDNTTHVVAVIKGITMDKINQAGDIVRDAMKGECPIGETGALKKSIRVRRYLKQLALKVLAGNAKAFYVHMVEFGTLHSAANPFMQRALDKSQAQIKAVFGTTVKVSE